MKNIKEKEQLIKMSLALGMEPDPKLVKEVLEYKQMIADIRKNSTDVVEVFEELAKLKEEDVLPKKVEQLEIPKPPSLDEIAFLLEEDVAEEIVEPPLVEIPKPPTVYELLEQLEIEEEPVEEKPKNKLIDLASSHITKEVMNEQKAATTFQQPDLPIPQTINELKRKVKMLEDWLAKVSLTGPGSGEVNLLKLDDVDTTNLANNRFLRYNAANAKLEFATVGGGGGGAVDSVNGLTGDVVLTTANVAESGNLYFTNERAVNSFTAGQNITIAANGLISANVSGGGGGSVDFENVSSNILPTSDSTFNLGSVNKRWKTLFLANNTIDLGGSLISSDGTGQVTISASGAVLPIGSKVEVGDKQEKIALVGNTGAVINVVPFFTQQLGLNTIATNFEFGANPDDFVFTNFTLSNGTSLQQAGVAQFYF
jgi:hypothetical protein